MFIPFQDILFKLVLITRARYVLLCEKTSTVLAMLVSTLFMVFLDSNAL